MSDVRKDLKKLTVEYKDGSTQEFDVEQGLMRLDTARIMEGTKLIKGYLQLSMHAEVAITPNHAALASDPPEALPDDFQEVPDE